mgnify:CR=1 FL=1
MPTYNRHKYVIKAIRMFSKQDYPNRELIILDDSPEPLKRLPKLNNITYVHSTRRQDIGTKRNRSIKLARGDIFIFWDDDDVYSQRRLSLQVAPLLKNNCDITVFGNLFYMREGNDAILSTSPRDHKRLWYKGYCCGTIASKKHVWDMVKFPRVSISEDREYIKRAESKGFKVCTVPNELDYIHVLHPNNTYVISSNVKFCEV